MERAARPSSQAVLPVDGSLDTFLLEEWKVCSWQAAANDVVASTLGFRVASFAARPPHSWPAEPVAAFARYRPVSLDAESHGASMVAHTPQVVIVGGGIGGLFTANALLERGVQVSVYEQAPSLGEIGAGVFLTPNGVRHLDRVGLGSSVEKWRACVGAGSRYLRHDGNPIAPVQVSDSSGWNAVFGMHRADLVTMLAHRLPADLVHTGHRCTGFDQDADAATLSFANGVVVKADVVIAADGIHSELRRHVAPPSSPVFSGSVAYRGLLPGLRDRGCRPASPSAR